MKNAKRIEIIKSESNRLEELIKTYPKILKAEISCRVLVDLNK